MFGVYRYINGECKSAVKWFKTKTGADNHAFKLNLHTGFNTYYKVHPQGYDPY